jgi:hypothetical protein
MPAGVHETHRYNVSILHKVLDCPQNVLIPVSGETLSDVELLPGYFPLLEGVEELVATGAGQV